MIPFTNRREAGRILALRLSEYARRTDVTVLGVPHGGMPVAFEVARALGVALDVFSVQKVFARELTSGPIGTIVSGGLCTLDQLDDVRLPHRAAERAFSEARRKLEQVEHLFRGSRPPRDVEGRTVILVYDGLVTGTSMIAAINALRLQRPARIVVAVPVATLAGCRAVERVADDCIYVIAPEPYYRTCIWYEDFSCVSDRDVIEFLDEAAGYTRVAA